MSERDLELKPDGGTMRHDVARREARNLAETLGPALDRLRADLASAEDPELLQATLADLRTTFEHALERIAGMERDLRVR